MVTPLVPNRHAKQMRFLAALAYSTRTRSVNLAMESRCSTRGARVRRGCTTTPFSRTGNGVRTVVVRSASRFPEDVDSPEGNVPRGFVALLPSRPAPPSGAVPGRDDDSVRRTDAP